ncbi:class I SAM-dependent methyltransferase [Paenibacillus silviterrae]|uniref:class I SAM-dependent methyltransferase n=1 Tax=Paenibacillus silviterrae TaxID=3242194 RepID=UPI0025430A1F|nr:class I SAM-dependent methyltransferase [Paenibacillus chinjuensis]
MEEEKVKEAVRQVFGQNAEKYVSSVSHAQGEDLELLLEWLVPNPSWTVLDVATGGGHVAKAVAPHVGYVFATDLTREMLAAAQKHVQAACGNVRFLTADAEKLPFLDESFDAVTCRIAAHHFPHAERFIQETARVLKPGGKLILIDNVVQGDGRIGHFVNEVERLRDESHGECHSVETWKSWFALNDLHAAKERLRKKTFDFPSWVRRTAASEEQVKRVEEYLLRADADLQHYVGLQLSDSGEILKIHIDEWMVMALKG